MGWKGANSEPRSLVGKLLSELNEKQRQGEKREGMTLIDYLEVELTNQFIDGISPVCIQGDEGSCMVHVWKVK